MLLNIRPKYIVLCIIFGLIPGLLYISFIITGYKYIPVGYTLGECRTDFSSPISFDERTEELKSTNLKIEDADILVCYGSPIAKEQNVYGTQIRFDELWQFGANEPTRFNTNRDLVVGEVVVPKGRYSVYVIPGRWKWEIFISKSTDHWGDLISDEVRAQEIGSFEVKPQYNPNFVEKLTISQSGNELVAEWGKTRIRIPIENIDESKEVKHTTILSKFRASL